MLPENLIGRLQDSSGTGRSTASPSGTNNTVTKFESGQQYQGVVQAKLGDGLFNVQISGQTIQMRLPNHIRSGEALKLEVIATRPKVTFAMIPSTNPLSTPEKISATAKILSNLAELPIERQTVQQLDSKVIWHAEQSAPDARLLADALREALGKSGLFYESHQAQWIRGERSVKQLLDEPQNVLAGGTTDQSATSPSSEIPLPVNKELLHLVQQQLHTLEHHHLAWIGHIWPEQLMHWEIQGEQEHQKKHGDERQWSSEIELELPKLGNVHASFVFTENGLSLTLNAANSKTLGLFNHTLPTLKEAFSRADIDPITVMVTQS